MTSAWSQREGCFAANIFHSKSSVMRVACLSAVSAIFPLQTLYQGFILVSMIQSASLPGLLRRPNTLADLYRCYSRSLDTPPQLARLVGAIENLRSTPYQSLVLDNGDQSHVSGFAPRAIDTPSSPGGYHTSSRAGESSRSPPPAEQRVVAQSSDTGNRISAPLSPPAHYPGSARPSSRRNSSSRTLNEVTSSDSSSTTSSGSSLASLQNSVTSMSSNGKPAPRWAHPPRYTNKISGRAWSFSQGQERPDVDFDPELFEDPEPEAVLEIMKGMEGRIAVKTTPAEYNIMAWLPGFS